ncbi:VC2046/SO_2500 family protein [Thalassotalea sp. PLHSN55]|uniref:VC2046/SO_2500 family protein n=1 Tax=Thalassotalea sp. PLHSN55 TaxID=3435888 RepID=UPI003F85B592
MVVNTLTKDILTHELQLGEELNKCVHQKRRSDFSLMLAMLTDDVREHSQFLVPQSDTPEIESTDALLRRQFALPEQAELALSEINDIKRFDQAQQVAENHLLDIKLADAVKPKPIAFRDDPKHIESQVLKNTSIHCQKKHSKNQTSTPSRLAFDAINWLNSLQTTIVKSTLVTA